MLTKQHHNARPVGLLPEETYLDMQCLPLIDQQDFCHFSWLRLTSAFHYPLMDIVAHSILGVHFLPYQPVKPFG